MNGLIIREEKIQLAYRQYVPDDFLIPRQQQFQMAASNDAVTIEHWRPKWVDYYKENHRRYGPFKDKSAGVFHKLHHHKPAIIVGSGPSLKHNVRDLLNVKGIPILACLHSFHFLEDHGVKPDFYLSLDSGDITVKELSEGGIKPESEYWDATKNHKLLVFAGSHPSLLEKWKGEVYFYNAPIPHADVQKEYDETEPFHFYLSTGGCVLGACVYFAKAILGCNPVVFVGADFAFDRELKFHPWKSSYDGNLGYVLEVPDVFGIPVKTWQSYLNFKNYFEWLARNPDAPGMYINCTEGGILGAHEKGNIRHIRQMTLKYFLHMQNICELKSKQCEDPYVKEKTILY